MSKSKAVARGASNTAGHPVSLSQSSPPLGDAAPSSPPTHYTVVARRYRPRQFAELIGQEHVAQALTNALQSGRIAHAYLFTGARGTGKTSAARILAKALNCVHGPTPTPCDQCERCLAIAEGQDVDVVEMDAASNRGIEESRGIRQNVGFLPVHSRFKVYIIDEVHMMTVPAFNALLKTIEEPPPHVKFILATTDVKELPITILSRCQRFDFAHISPASIFQQLKSIVAREGLEADDDALRLIARRANGSMRDSQSLLDQLLASSPGRLTAEHVLHVLGSAADERVAELADALLAHDAAKALNFLTQATQQGLLLSELTDQLIDYWRALMLVTCAGPGVEDLPVTPTQKERILQQARSTTLDTILAGLDILTTAKARMRGSVHQSVLLEMALVRLARLEELLSVRDLLAGNSPPLTSSSPPGSRPAVSSAPSEQVKKNGTPTVAKTSHPDRNGPISDPQPPPGRSTADPSTDATSGLESSYATIPDPIPESHLPALWQRVLRQMTQSYPVLANHLSKAHVPAILGPNVLAIRFSGSYSVAYDYCAGERNAAKVQEALGQAFGRPVKLRWELLGGAQPASADVPSTPPSPQGRRKELMALPLFRYAAERLGAQLTQVDEDFDPRAVQRSSTGEPKEEEDDGESPRGNPLPPDREEDD